MATSTQKTSPQSNLNMESASSSPSPSPCTTRIYLDEAETTTIHKIQTLLSPIAKFKERSYQTSKENHLPIFQNLLFSHMHFRANAMTASPSASSNAESSPTKKDSIPLSTRTHFLPPIDPLASLCLSQSRESQPPVSSDFATLSRSPASNSSKTGIQLQSSPKKVEIVLLGDSMMERMTTTGPDPQISQPLPCLGDWPPAQIIPSSDLLSLNLSGGNKRIPDVLNLGVGGDRVQNIVYRLVGSSSPAPSPPTQQGSVQVGVKKQEGDIRTHLQNTDHLVTDQPLEGYLPFLFKLKTVKLWVVQAGTNNLNLSGKKVPQKGLSQKDVDDLGILIKCLLMIPSHDDGSARSRVLLTGLFQRTDSKPETIRRANEMLMGLVEALNQEWEDNEKEQEFRGDINSGREWPSQGEAMSPNKGKSKGEPKEEEKKEEIKAIKRKRVIFSPPCEDIDISKHLVDHVHLGLEGYRIWLRELVPKVVEAFEGVE